MCSFIKYFKSNIIKNTINHLNTRGGPLTSADSSLIKMLFSFKAYYYTRNGITTTDGLFVIVGNRTIPPAIYANSIRLRPNVATDLRLRQTTISRQSAPYPSQCIDAYPPQYDSPPGLFNYSESNCQGFCQSIIVFNSCNCWHPYFISPYVRNFVNIYLNC